jgi:hypothetical protein
MVVFVENALAVLAAEVSVSPGLVVVVVPVFVLFARGG